MSRVRIGTCANPADAAFIRSMFSARGIEVVIAAEHHASLLGAIGSGFLSLDIWVADGDAEEAAALLRDLRSGSPQPSCGDEGNDVLPEAAEAAGDADDPDAGDAPDRPAEPEDTDEDLEAQLYRRRRTGLAFLLGACITFGTAHMVVGAWLRGALLAVLEIVGIRAVVHDHRVGSLLIGIAIITDITGALWQLHTAGRAELPVARLRRRR